MPYSDFVQGLGYVVNQIDQSRALAQARANQKIARDMDLYLETLKSADLDAASRVAAAKSGVSVASPSVAAVTKSQLQRQKLAEERIAFNYNNLLDDNALRKQALAFQTALGLSSVFVKAGERSQKDRDVNEARTALSSGLPQGVT
jgi:hypothetical protein